MWDVFLFSKLGSQNQGGQLLRWEDICRQKRIRKEGVVESGAVVG